MTEELSCIDCSTGITLVNLPIMGLCFRFCATCQPVCSACRGRGAYPEWTNDPDTAFERFNGTGLQPLLCHGCLGIVGIIAKPAREARIP